jgi:tRNA threonylcarbamoyladenosine biosynthesis protein TsaE
MITDNTWGIDTNSPRNTEELAENIGRHLKGGELIQLVSDLGGGKTTFVRGLAKGAGSLDKVSSPTFKISNEYHGKNIDLIHFDFYRLAEAGIMSNELAEIIGDPRSVIVIEWADVVENQLPAEKLTITFSNKGDRDRHLSFAFPESLSYLMKDLI